MRIKAMEKYKIRRPEQPAANAYERGKRRYKNANRDENYIFKDHGLPDAPYSEGVLDSTVLLILSIV